MKSQAIFDAINESQDNRPLRKWMLREQSMVQHWSFTDALSALLVFAWRDADDPDALESDLFYAQQQIKAARMAVQKKGGVMPKTRNKMGQLSRERHAEVSWCAEDIQVLRPDWDDKRCNDFLMRQEDDIQCAMIERGWDAIRDLLRLKEVVA